MPVFSTLRTSIAGLAVADLARQFGTPLFVYDAGVLLERLADLAAFDFVRYAQKACSNLALLDLLRRHGALVDAVSAGEIRRALAAGFPAQGAPPPIVYTADIFDAESLDLCIEQGIHVNCGSPDMIEQLGRRASGREISLRINPGFGHGHNRKTNTGGDQAKHGIWHAQLGRCLALARQHGLAVTGLHMHIGSGTDLEHLGRVCGAIEQAAGEVGPGLASINVGGGLPVPYRSGESYVDLAAYFALCDAARGRLQRQFGHALRLEIEPGRYLVAECGYLLAEIRAVKQQGERWFYLLDAGFNNLARPIMYGAYHPMAIVPKGTVPFSSDENRDSPRQRLPEREVIVGGPLCESGDIFTQSEGGYVCPRALPEARVGDWLVIECAGAYGFVMGSNYNSRPLAAEVLVYQGRPHLIRRRQTFEDLVRGESVLEEFRS
ncbi:MAG: diaminopimelate decarboxylase [Thermoguttaceae bacterium]|jgi:diaminopimelate decarboxylase